MADINAKELTVSGAVANDKTYDGNTHATISGASLVGIVGSDDVELDALVGTFAQATVGTDIEVTAALTLKGADKDNYSLTQPTGLMADITARDLTLTNFVADNKTYDGNTNVTGDGFDDDRVVGDVLTFSYDVAFEDEYVGTDKVVNFTNIVISGGIDKDNYSLVTTSGTATADILPVQVATSVTVSPTVVQYSDEVRLTARIVGGAALVQDGPQAAASVRFTIGGQIMNTIPVDLIKEDDDLVAVLDTVLVETTVPGSMAPQAGKTVTAIFLSPDENFALSHNPASTTLEVTPEDARIIYTGDMIKAAESTNATSVTFDLIANIYDISAGRFSSDPASDPFPGDIRNARVQFVNSDNENNISLNTSWHNVTDLVVAGDTRIGTIMVPGGLTIEGLSNSNPSRQIRIGIIVDNGYYIRNSEEDDVVITAYLPNGDFITGGGYLVTTASAGRKASDDNKKVNFGFNVKFNKTGKNLQGSMNIIFRRTEADGRVHNLQIKANAMQSLGVNTTNPQSMTAEYVSKVSIKDLNSSNSNGDPDLGGNKMLYVKMVDNGDPGTNDMISFVLVNGNDNPNVLSNIIWSSNWTGDLTEMMNLDGGNLVVHSGFSIGEASSETTSKKAAEISLMTDGMSDPVFKAYPNPFSDMVYFDLVRTSDANVRLEIFDIRGAKLTTVFDSRIEAGISYRFEYKPDNVVPGMLIYRLMIDNEVINGKILYQKQR